MLSTTVTVDSIDEAWSEAEIACPPGWIVWGVRAVVHYLATDGVLRLSAATWRARAVSANPLIDCMGDGRTKASALRDLADNLRRDYR